jgi:DNA mismatch endonuclease (patch repair protein)
MSDFLSPAERSARMAAIAGKDTVPELVLRSGLHRMGLRFRLHAKGLPGKPDVVLPKYKTAVFVHGCFWHRHENCRIASTPKSNTDFWIAKFERNVNRDATVREQLLRMGWRVVVVWECELTAKSKVQETIRSLADKIRDGVALQE